MQLIAKARKAAEKELVSNPNVKTDTLAAGTPLLVGTDPNGHTGVVFATSNGMAVEVNYTPQGKLFLKNYCPVSFATQVYK